MTHRIIVDEHGMLRCLHNPDVPMHELGVVKHTRVSHITPAWSPQRQVFWLLRLLFGERGKVAAWTRTWRCVWKAKMVRCGEWSVFFERHRAIRWELEHLNSCDECNISNQPKFDV